MKHTWKQFTETQVVDFCNNRGSRTFTLDEFQVERNDEIVSFRPTNNFPFDKIRQQLQLLRDDGIITFEDNRGTYTLRRPVFLKDELQEGAPLGLDTGFAETKNTFKYEDGTDNHNINILAEKREYTHETFARNRGWVKLAKDKFGCQCLYPSCSNSFLKPDGESYIEVHHIIPLFQNGEDALWNLTVVCAHHHRMAHFAENIVKDDLQKLFLGIVNERLEAKFN
jgi:5-methylcytosine-specific restriction endonuclease McrA